MKILLQDHYHNGNKGDIAIIQGTLNALSKHFDNPKFHILTDSPDSIPIYLKNVTASKQHFINFHWLSFKKNLTMLYLLIGAFFYRYKITLPKFKNNITEPYLESDALISKGGSFLSDYYSPSMYGRLYWLYFMYIIRKPVFIYGQSLGPYFKRTTIFIAKKVLNKVNVIMLRDKISEEVIAPLLLDKPKISISADAAWNCLDSNKYTNNFTKSKTEIDPTISSDSFNVSFSVRHWLDTKDQEKFVRTIAHLAKWLIDEHNANLYFLSTCTGIDGYQNDDRIVATKIIDELPSGYSAKVFMNEYTPKELVNLYRQMNLHIGTRMHSNILALLGETPVIPIQCEYKTLGLMKFFRLENYVIDINEADTRVYEQKITKLLKNYDSIKNIITSKIPTLKTEAAKSAKIISDYLKAT